MTIQIPRVLTIAAVLTAAVTTPSVIPTTATAACSQRAVAERSTIELPTWTADFAGGLPIARCVDDRQTVTA
jgi:hypothetical protein